MPHNPSPPPGEPPRSNPGQMDVGEQYTALDSQQDVRRPGYYFSTADRVLRYFDYGETLPGEGDTWYFVSDDRDLSLDDAAATLRRYGFSVEPEDLRVV